MWRWWARRRTASWRSARIASLEPDLVTLDIEMPEMNGIEVLEAMHASGQKTTVIMLSSLTVKGGQMTIRALEAGAFDFITKPEGKSQNESLLQLRDSLRPIIQTLARQREIRSILKSRAIKAPARRYGRARGSLTRPRAVRRAARAHPLY